MSHDNPRDAWFYSDRKTLEMECHWQECDLLGAHERILGVKIAELACNESLETVLFDRPCSHLLQGLGDDEAVVLASMSGIAGDCGAYSAQMFLMSPHSKHTVWLKMRPSFSEPLAAVRCCGWRPRIL